MRAFVLVLRCDLVRESCQLPGGLLCTIVQAVHPTICESCDSVFLDLVEEWLSQGFLLILQHFSLPLKDITRVKQVVELRCCVRDVKMSGWKRAVSLCWRTRRVIINATIEDV